MFCISLESSDPFYNMAIEEILFKNSNEEYLILGINSPSVIIGKHQCANREVNTKFTLENNIPVIRRISGGGTVFHDFGNLNFTFISQSEPGKQIDFRKYTRPVIDFLFSLGINAKFEGRNDIKIDGLKISGNAEHVHRNRVLHHGTLLFSSSLKMLRNSIRTDNSRYTTRAVESNPSSVTNLADKLTGFNDIFEFRSGMMNFLIENLPKAAPYNLSQTISEKAKSLSISKYKTWEWNLAYGPEYSFNNTFQIDGTEHSCRLSIKDGIIWKCTIEGSGPLIQVAKKLIGSRHMVEDLTILFKKENINISYEEIFNFF